MVFLLLFNRFERHVIFYLFVVMVISVCVILPINFQVDPSDP